VFAPDSGRIHGANTRFAPTGKIAFDGEFVSEPATKHQTMRKNIIPFGRAKRSVKEVLERFYQDLDDIEEIVIIAKDREGEWIFANSELENELEWIGSLYKFINKAILEDGEDF